MIHFIAHFLAINSLPLQRRMPGHKPLNFNEDQIYFHSFFLRCAFPVVCYFRAAIFIQNQSFPILNLMIVKKTQNNTFQASSDCSAPKRAQPINY